MRSCRQGSVCLLAALVLTTLGGCLKPGPQLQAQGSEDNPSPSARSGANAVDYQGLLRMLKQNVPEEKILQKLEDSTTHFTLSDEQLQELKEAGATEAILDALRKKAVRKVESDVRNIAVVLDCSGSMLDKMPDGKTKMESAKKVVREFIRRIPNGKSLTFIVYGTDPDRKCQDVTVKQPLTTVSPEIKEELDRYISDLVPLGNTPLALSMKKAGVELTKGGKAMSMLVVITDGMESCKGKPGEVAEQLVRTLNLPSGVDLIPFGVEEEEKQALKALASKAVNVRVADKGEEDLNAQLRKAEEEAKRKASQGGVKGDGDWESLFNGKDLEGWEGREEVWKVEDGAIVASSFPSGRPLNTFLCTKRKFKDFELEFRVRIRGKNTSGVMIRSQLEDRENYWLTGIKCDIGASPHTTWSTLVTYDGKNGRVLKRPADSAIEQADINAEGFNQYTIRCVGEQVTVRINGVVMLDTELPELRPEGVIALQLRYGNASAVAFKDIRIKQLGQKKAAQDARKPREVRTTQGKKIRFALGDISWADRVVSFKPGNPGPRRSKDPEAALGPPDFQGKDDAEDQKHYVALGHGGVLVLEFTDNVLIDGEGPDLAIFEIGPEIEPMEVAISEDGKKWIRVGEVKGGKCDIDIGPFVKPGQEFRFVRITDAKGGKSNNSDWPGADVDAVGAINTRATEE